MQNYQVNKLFKCLYFFLFLLFFNKKEYLFYINKVEYI